MAKRTKCSQRRSGDAAGVSPQGLAVYFADVGQGDCTIAVSPAERAALVTDCSHFSHALDLLERAGRPELTVIITHWHQDHVSGMAHLLLNYRGAIRAVYYNQFPVLDHARRTVGASYVTGSLLYVLIKLARQRRFAVCASVRPGDWIWGTADTGAVAVYPSADEQGEAVKSQDQNKASIVVEVRCYDQVVLLGADLPAREWLRLTRQERLSRAVALKVPHHGARLPSSFAKQITAALGPELAIVSVGTYNRHGHPDRNCLRQWAAVCRVMCTQVTKHCCPDTMPRRSRVLTLLKQTASQAVMDGCPCAGTVVIEMNEEGYHVLPDPIRHDAVVALFGSPQCRAGGDP